jgi:hypothetical protein
MNTPGSDSPIVTLGLNLSRSCRYLHEHQGVSKEDLVWVLHGILGQVLALPSMSGLDRFGDEPGDEDDDDDNRPFKGGGRSYDPTDLGDP